MSDISFLIRKVIFEKFNDPDTRFTNDEVFTVMQQNGSIEQTVTIDDVESNFTELCNVGLMRNIAQNFTTQWFKLFEPLEALKCNSCQNEVYVNKSEEHNCPKCNASI